MQKRHSRSEFLALLGFLILTTLVLTNGFRARIFAQATDVDLYSKLEPIGDVLNKILEEYVKEPDVDKVVEGALVGMMNSLDRHSSFISAEALERMKEDTKGEFEGIGVQIQFDDDKNIVIFQPLPDSPAAKAGIVAGDIIMKIDGIVTSGMALSEAARLIRGPRDTVVVLTIYRKHEEGEPEIKDISIKRGNIPLESIKEARLLPNNIGYCRISDFKDTTAKDLEKALDDLLQKGMTSLVLDLRWNSGGLLTASKQVSELFLPKNTLVTYTCGRKNSGSATEDMKLYTERASKLPEKMPMVILTNEDTASSSEIVTGALQFWSRAIVVGQKTYGKGSVQTIIPLARPAGSALRLTTALYYTPAEVTIDGEGIKPDVEVLMTREQQRALWKQMIESSKGETTNGNEQNHGTVTGNEATAETVEDVQLKRAVEILQENPVFDNLVAKYHKDTHETQVAAPPDQVLKQGPEVERSESRSVDIKEKSPEKQDAPEQKPDPSGGTPSKEEK